MGVIPHGKTTGQGVKGKTAGLSATKTGIAAGHSFTISRSGKTDKKSGLAALTGRGKQ
ncbi:hypothetical protein HZC31_04485 [Candidatus Woesearchaeota archaeon]|nr:hypothetical protein [Candidatus Woesearchaeota archaeon]